MTQPEITAPLVFTARYGEPTPFTWLERPTLRIDALGRRVAKRIIQRPDPRRDDDAGSTR